MKLKIILYIAVPLVVIVLIVKEFLLKIRIDTKETLGIGIGLVAVLWVGFFIFNRFLTKDFKRYSPSTGSGFQIIRKGKTAGTKTEAPPRKFYSTGLFQIIHKGQRMSPSDEDDDRLFKMPVYPGRSGTSNDIGKPKDKIQKEAHFGTAGIRGLTNIEITPLLVLKMSEIYGSYLLDKRGVGIINVAVGYDSRYGSEMLAKAVISGLNSAGVNTQNCGCITTGGLASFIVCNKLDGGILITGSHTPYNMTGFIILNSDGSYLDMEISREIENRYRKYESFRQPVKPENIGSNKDALEPFECYKSFLLERINSASIKSKQYRVLVDPANGPATLILPEILKELSCSVFLVNDQLSPVPNRPSEPRAYNLIETASKVKEYKCDIGIATDVDADRVLFIDAAGSVLSEDLVGAIFAREIISSNKVCVTPINSSSLIEETISNCGGKLEYCRIGQPETTKAIKQSGASFSYEESGKYYFCKDALWPDALLSSVKLLEIMAKSNKSLAKIASEFPQFCQVKHTLPYDSLIGDSRKKALRGVPVPEADPPSADKRANLNINKIFQKVQELWTKQYLEGSVKDVTIDGLKRIYQDKSWLLIRKSGTEHLIRIYADAPSCERAEQLVSQGEDIVKNAIKAL